MMMMMMMMMMMEVPSSAEMFRQAAKTVPPVC
jgi:hypothetical protein